MNAEPVNGNRDTRMEIELRDANEVFIELFEGTLAEVTAKAVEFIRLHGGDGHIGQMTFRPVKAATAVPQPLFDYVCPRCDIPWTERFPAAQATDCPICRESVDPQPLERTTIQEAAQRVLDDLVVELEGRCAVTPQLLYRVKLMVAPAMTELLPAGVTYDIKVSPRNPSHLIVVLSWK